MKLMDGTFSALRKTVVDLGKSHKSEPQKTRMNFVRSLVKHYGNLKVAKKAMGIE